MNYSILVLDFPLPPLNSLPARLFLEERDERVRAREQRVRGAQRVVVVGARREPRGGLALRGQQRAHRAERHHERRGHLGGEGLTR